MFWDITPYSLLKINNENQRWILKNYTYYTPEGRTPHNHSCEDSDPTLCTYVLRTNCIARIFALSTALREQQVQLVASVT
jgi:hypothetical protein